jgi:hypothetical protein
MTKRQTNKKVFARRHHEEISDLGPGLAEQPDQFMHDGDLRHIDRDIREETASEKEMDPSETVERVSQTTAYSVILHGKEYLVEEIEDDATDVTRIESYDENGDIVTDAQLIIEITRSINEYQENE